MPSQNQMIEDAIVISEQVDEAMLREASEKAVEANEQYQKTFNYLRDQVL